MSTDYQTEIFQIEALQQKVCRQDLREFKSIGLDRIKDGSHLAQLNYDGRTIGLASLQVYPRYEEVHMSFIEIRSEFRGDQLGRRLLVSVFDYAATMSQELGGHSSVIAGGFTPKGERSILPVMRELGQLYHPQGVSFNCPERYVT